MGDRAPDEIINKKLLLAPPAKAPPTDNVLANVAGLITKSKSGYRASPHFSHCPAMCTPF